MSKIFNTLHHVCIVVEDIDAAQAFYESVGIGNWQPYPPLDEYTELDVPNRSSFLRLKYRYADLANVQLQLCEPPQEDCPQRRFLTEKGEGVFQLGFVVDELDGTQAQAEAMGLAPLMRGRRPDGSGFTYFDTVADTGTNLLIRKTPQR